MKHKTHKFHHGNYFIRGEFVYLKRWCDCGKQKRQIYVLYDMGKYTKNWSTDWLKEKHDGPRTLCIGQTTTKFK